MGKQHLVHLTCKILRVQEQVWSQGKASTAPSKVSAHLHYRPPLQKSNVYERQNSSKYQCSTKSALDQFSYKGYLHALTS